MFRTRSRKSQRSRCGKVAPFASTAIPDGFPTLIAKRSAAAVVENFPWDTQQIPACRRSLQHAFDWTAATMKEFMSECMSSEHFGRFAAHPLAQLSPLDIKLCKIRRSDENTGAPPLNSRYFIPRARCVRYFIPRAEAVAFELVFCHAMIRRWSLPSSFGKDCRRSS